MKRAIAALVFVLSFVSAGAVYAGKVSLDPAHVRLEVLPGGSTSGSLRVDNPSGEEVKIRVYLEDWRYSSCSDGSKEFFPPGTMPLSCAKWIDFSPAEFTIPPFGRQAINYTVRLPQDAKGGHFSVMFFETDMSESGGGDVELDIKLKARLGALFVVEAKDSLACEAGLSGLTVSRDSGVFKIAGNFKNSGNTDIAPRITFDIIDPKGEVYARGKFSDIFTLPQDECRIEAETKEHLNEGEYILIITLNLGRGRPKVMEVPISVGASSIKVN